MSDKFRRRNKGQKTLDAESKIESLSLSISPLLDGSLLEWAHTRGAVLCAHTNFPSRRGIGFRRLLCRDYVFTVRTFEAIVFLPSTLLNVSGGGGAIPSLIFFSVCLSYPGIPSISFPALFCWSEAKGWHINYAANGLLSLQEKEKRAKPLFSGKKGRYVRNSFRRVAAWRRRD